MLATVLNVAYLLLVLAASPVLLYRAIVHGKYREGWAEKLLGSLPDRRQTFGTAEATKPCVWFHAVSVGEVLQLRGIIAELCEHRPDVKILVTATTHTGQAVAREKFPEHTIAYFPLDFSWAVRRAIRRVQPAAIVLVELELWPNFILEAGRQDVPLALVNSRMGEKSYRGYRRIRPLIRRLLRSFDAFGVQNESYARRLIELGAPSERVRVTGSVKFDHVEANRDNPQTAELRRAFGIGANERVFIAGSTQPPEEEYALDVWERLRNEHPELRLILVPRHRERFEEVAAFVQRRGLPLVRRSGVRGQGSGDRPQKAGNVRAGDDLSSPPAPSVSATYHSPVLLLDTLGELGACWGLADFAFVGGSLTDRGGQNMLEPAAFGAAVCFGPNTWNFRDTVDALLGEDAARVVDGPAGLDATLREWLESPQAARQQGVRAQKLVLSQQGATAATVEIVAEMLETNQRNLIQWAA